MKKLFLLASLFFCIQGYGQMTNFSGRWIINTNKISFGQAPQNVLPKTFRVEQQSANIFIERVMVDDKAQEHKLADSLAFSNRPEESTVITDDGRKRTASVAWSADNKVFVLSSHSVDKDNNPGGRAMEVWSLEGDKTLLVTRYVEQADGLKNVIRGYYNKQ